MGTTICKCRKCKEQNGTIFLDSKGQSTKKPICRDCFEREVRTGVTNFDIGLHKSGNYYGPTRDPYHELLDDEISEMLEFYRELRFEDY